MIPPLAVLDSCVLYSAALRDLFMRLDNAGLYRARWTERIHDEWIRNVLLDRPDLTRVALERTRALMDLHAEGSVVEDYESLIPSLTLPDEEDRHVLAAAIVAEASVVVTFNLADFPEAVLTPNGVEAQHPDAFLCALFDASPDRFMEVVKELVAGLHNPPRTLEQQGEILRRQGLAQLAERLFERIRG